MPREKHHIPGMLNIVLTMIASCIALSLLYCASQTHSWGVVCLCALGFSFINNTLFSLLHEAVHGIFHENDQINNWFGRFLAVFFPTAFSFQKICHLGHHQRNRSEVEMFDYIQENDSKVLKYLQWYGILTGVYWMLSPIACVLYLIFPRAFQTQWLRDKDSVSLQHTSADAMLSGFDDAPQTLIRLEILATIALQACFIYTLEISLVAWCCCYIAFAVNWSSLQYADHAWSALDTKHGAWNLKVNKMVQWLFLNYHHHLAHHQHPQVPWLFLDKYVDFERPRPSFLRVYLSMWRGPQPIHKYPEEMEEFVKESYETVKQHS